MENEHVWNEMSQGAKAFYKPDAAMKIARAIVDIALGHEKR